VDAGAVLTPALRRGVEEDVAVLTAAARLHVVGAHVDWPAFFAGSGARRVDLPTYAFEHQRFWPETAPAGARARTADDGFWDAVRAADYDTLASALDVDGDALARVLPALDDWRRGRDEDAAVGRWHQRIVWRPLTGHRTGPGTGTWLAAIPHGSADDPWVGRVLAALPPGAVPVEVGDPDRAELADRLRALEGSFTGVVSMLALAEAPSGPEGPAPLGVALTATLVQALGDAGIDAPLWCLTRGADAVARTEDVPGLAQSAVWGLGRVAALEHPDRWGGLVDLPETIDDRSADRLASLLADSGGEDQIAVRSAALFGRRLVPAPPGPGSRPWDADGTVLITGGTGALGVHVARGLAQAGTRHLVLVSRSGPDAPGADALRADLTALGADVTITACDAADRDAVAAVLASLPEDAPLTGVVHAAGVLDDGILDGLTPDRFAAVFRAKVASALVLDDLTRELDLSVFALFSSASAAIGNPGQANYAAANAVLDALAERRRAHGLPATSVAWGAWGGDGMAADERALSAARRTGVKPLDPDRAVLALRRAVTEAEPTVVVADVDQGQFLRMFTGLRPNRLFADLPEYTEMTGDDGTGAGRRPELADLPADRRGPAVLALVRQHAAEVLGHPGPEHVSADRAFRDLGLDSLGAVELRNRLTTASGLTLPATLVFDHPNPAALADHIAHAMDPGAGTDPDADDDDARIRELLASVPVARLRDAGLLDRLLALTDPNGANGHDPDQTIEDMEVDDLVRAVLNGSSPSDKEGLDR